MEENYDFDSIDESSVKLLTLGNGTCVIAQVLLDEEGEVFTFLPMEIVLELGELDMEVKQYELVPYLDHLTPFNVMDPVPVIFNKNLFVSISVPNMHLLRNYYLTIKTMRDVIDESRNLIREDVVIFH